MASKSIPKTMRSIVHNQKHQTMTLTSQPVPIPTAGEYLLEVESVAITSGELLWPKPPELNESCPGTDMAGRVVQAPAASKFKEGDKVYMRTTYPRPGSAREYSIGLDWELALRPNNISAVEAAAVPVSALTAWQALFIHAAVGPISASARRNLNNETTRVLVNGASSASGLWMIQLAHLAGCHVIGTTSAKNVPLVKEMGAHEVIDYTKSSITTWFQHKSKVDIVLDCVGGSSFEDAWHAANDHGKVITIVPPLAADGSISEDIGRPKDINNSVTGKFFIMQSDGEILDKITSLIEAGKVRPVVDSVYPLEEYQKGFDRLESKRAVGKVVLKVAE